MFEIGQFIKFAYCDRWSDGKYAEVTDIIDDKTISILRCPQECKDARDFELEYFAL